MVISVGLVLIQTYILIMLLFYLTDFKVSLLCPSVWRAVLAKDVNPLIVNVK